MTSSSPPEIERYAEEHTTPAPAHLQALAEETGASWPPRR